MTLEFRAIRDDEYAAHSFIASYSFNSDRGDEATERRRYREPPEWCRAGFLDGEMVSGLVLLPLEMDLAGARIAMGGISTVSCLPEHRRGGHVSGLLRHTLAEMRGRGMALSALYTPHNALYGRYGWEVASRTMSYAWGPKDVRVTLPAAPGRVRRVGRDDWPLLASLYDAHAARRNSLLARDETWWREYVFESHEPQPRDAAVWEDESGTAQGYAVYRTVKHTTPNSPWPQARLRVHDLVALDSGALAGLLAYLNTHDLSERIILLAGSDDLLPSAFDVPDQVEQRSWQGILLRIVDVERAFESRPAPAGITTAVRLRITDQSAPWNDGTWRIECAEGRMAASRTDDAPQLTIDIRDLAPLFNGYALPAEMRRISRVTVDHEEAIDTLTAMLRLDVSPFCVDEF
jgi:predicted acetyltransferase